MRRAASQRLAAANSGAGRRFGTIVPMTRAIPFVLVAVALAGGCKEVEEKDRAPVGMMGGDDSAVIPGADTANETEGPSTTTGGGGGSGGTTGGATDTGGGTAGGSAGDTVGDTAGSATGAQDTEDDGPSLTTDEPPPE